MMDPAEELRTVHPNRVKNIGKLVDGRWFWPAAFTPQSLDQQSSQSSPPSHNQPISDELTTNLNNIVVLRDYHNSLDLTTSAMDERSRLQRGLQNPASQKLSSTGTKRPNSSSRSGSYFLNAIDTLVAPSPAPTSVRASSEVDALGIPTAERVGDGPYMYAPRKPSTEGRTLKDPKQSAYVAPAGKSSINLKYNKNPVLPKTPDHSDGHSTSLLHASNKAQSHAEKPKHNRKVRLSQSQGVINKRIGLDEVKEAPGARSQERPKHAQPSQSKKVTSSEQVQALTNNPELQSPPKPKTPTAKSHHQLPIKPRQVYEPMVIDTLPGRYEKDDAPVSHLDALVPHRKTPPAIKAYRERYLPSIQAGAFSNKPKATLETKLKLSTPNMGPALSAFPAVGLLAKETSAQPLAKKQDEPMLSNHPSVTGSFQTPGAVPYNLTPSPVSSEQGSGDYEPYGCRSFSPSNSHYDIPDIPSISVIEAVSTKAASTSGDFANSPTRRGYNSDTRAPAIEEKKKTIEPASSLTLPNHAISQILRDNNLDTQTPADKEVENAFDLTHSPTPSAAPNIQQPPPSPIDLTYSPSPSPELSQNQNQNQPIDLTWSPTPTPELEDLQEQHHPHTRDGCAPSPSPELFDTMPRETVPAENMRSSCEEVGNSVNATEFFHTQAFEVAATPDPGQQADEFIQGKFAHDRNHSIIPSSCAVHNKSHLISLRSSAAHNKRRPIPRTGTVVEAVTSVEAPGSSHPVSGFIQDKATQNEGRFIPPRSSAKASTAIDANPQLGPSQSVNKFIQDKVAHDKRRLVPAKSSARANPTSEPSQRADAFIPKKAVEYQRRTIPPRSSAAYNEKLVVQSKSSDKAGTMGEAVASAKSSLPPTLNQRADALMQEKAARNERRIGPSRSLAAHGEGHLIPPRSPTKASTFADTVASVRANRSFEFATSGDSHAMEIDEPAQVDKSSKVVNSVEDNTMEIDEQLSSDLSDAPSDSELNTIKDQTEKLLKAKKTEQALFAKIVGPPFPRGTYLPWAPHLAPPLSTIGYDEYEFAKEGEYFDLAYCLFMTIPKRVFDKIWLDEHERPQISMYTGPPIWVRPYEPPSKAPIREDPRPIEIINVVTAVEKTLLQIWLDVELIVLMLYAELDEDFTGEDLTMDFRIHQLRVCSEWHKLYAHLVTLADFKERFFAASNVEKRASGENSNPYKRLFTMKNSAGVLFYGTKQYFDAMHAAIKDAWDAFDCAEMKHPRYKQLVGMNKTVMGEEFANCLDGLREFHTFTRMRDWDVVANSEDEQSSEDEPTSPKTGSKQSADKVSSKGKGKGKAVAAEEDSYNEQSDDMRGGNPADYYEEVDDDEDGDYIEGDFRRYSDGPQSVVHPSTRSKKRGIALSFSSHISSDDEMTANNRGGSSHGNELELPAGAGHVQAPKVTGVRKGAKRLMVEVSDGSGPKGVKSYFETP